MNFKQVAWRAHQWERRILLVGVSLLSIYTFILVPLKPPSRDMDNGRRHHIFSGKKERSGLGHELNGNIQEEKIVKGAINERSGLEEIRKDEGGHDMDREEVVILMWTKYYTVDDETFQNYIASGMSWEPGCCDGVEITRDRSQLKRATAVVFYHYFGNLDRDDLPPTRRPDQLWILFGKESPALSPLLDDFNDLFNWTMNYRHDADIWAPYGQSIKLEDKINLEVNGVSLSQWTSEKTHLIAAVISHCNTTSKRETYIKQLRELGGIPVDIYGACGTNICLRQEDSCNHTAWWTELASKYKFYFSAENSICSDYITEKFWRPLELGMVPVTYGGGNYIDVAPPDSFIDTRHFVSPEELADYLRHLDNSMYEYQKYFDWRKEYMVMSTDTWHAWCDLCKKVREYKRKLEENPEQLSNLTKVYSDLEGWWIRKPPPDNSSYACLYPE